jgi:DNA-binding MarR family transcriptional regulator
VGVHDNQDRADRSALLSFLIEAPTRTRRIYQRKGFADLEPNVLQVLIAVELRPDSTVSELLQTLALAQGTVSTAVSGLQARRLLKVVRDEGDARRQLLRVTPSGRALIDRFLAQLDPELHSR